LSPSGGVAIAASWLWDHLLVAITLAFMMALILIGALASGWNTPRPGQPPAWEAPTLPRRVEVASGGVSLSLLNHPDSDFTFEVIARPLVGPSSGFYDYGLIYRAQDATRYYVFAVGADGYYTVMRVDGEDVTPLVAWQQFPHVRRGGRANRLRLTCAGSTCTFTVNDEYAAKVEDDTWLSGDVGLWVRGFDGGAVVEFHSARVWNPDG